MRDAIGAAQNGTFNNHEMGDEFRRRPGFRGGLRGPLVGGYAIGGAKEGTLSFRELMLNAVELLHASLTLPRVSMGRDGLLAGLGPAPRRKNGGMEKNLEPSGAGLLKGVGQLKNPCFAKGRAEDLKAHGKASSDAAARHGDARKTR